MHTLLGIANPLLDYIVHISEKQLLEVTQIKGGMEPISHEGFVQILKKYPHLAKIQAGGSATNVMKGLSQLGEACALTGKIGQDEAAHQFLANIQEHEIEPLYSKTTTPTGKVLCLVTPDGERTMRTYLGASIELSPDDLDERFFQGVQLVHIEGYAILKEEVALRAMELAKQAGAKISFDLANFEMVQEKREFILYLLKKYIDLLFGNEKEAFALTQLDPKEGGFFLKQYCDVIATSRGKQGCVVTRGQEQITSPAIVIDEPLDTTGAGDLFTSGFLYGYLKQKELKECAQLGCLLGAAVVQVDGAEIPQASWPRLKKEFNSI